MLRLPAGGRMKFKARYLVMHQAVLEAPSAQHAANSIPHNCKLLGVIPADEEWPDTEKPAPRPPRNTPPGGSPGTPTVTTPPEVAHAVAA